MVGSLSSLILAFGYLFEPLIHELSHAIVALLSGGKIVSILVWGLLLYGIAPTHSVYPNEVNWSFSGTVGSYAPFIHIAPYVVGVVVGGILLLSRKLTVILFWVPMIIEAAFTMPFPSNPTVDVTSALSFGMPSIFIILLVVFVLGAMELMLAFILLMVRVARFRSCMEYYGYARVWRNWVVFK